MSITKERMLEIEEITSNLLKDVNFEKTPYVDIVSLVKKDGFIVEPKNMDSETTGMLFVHPKNERFIFVNTSFKNPDNESDVVFKKSRFITAHEYGHFILHKDLFAHRDTYHRTELKELEADYFARSILMPLTQFKMHYELLIQMSNNDKTFIVDLLSRIYKVTKQKINKRLEDILVLAQ